RTLISDVEGGSASFRAVLVYDVSRWGRFQDADESAYYEHICKRAGISVRYCAEPFENDGSPVSAIVKNVKRLMAGEYSRELSSKVFAGQLRLVKLGYRQGAPPGYGLRRLLIDQAGSPKSVLERGQLKSIHTDRIILIPGPAQEVQRVKWMFRAFISGLSERDIATRLNSREISTHLGRRWTRAAVLEVLTNEKYLGHNVWNRASKKLKGRRIKNDPESWIRSDEAFEPLVDRKHFDAVQKIMQGRKARRTDQDMLKKLADVLKERGYLSAKTIAEAKGLMSSQAYKHRFGGLLGAYQRVGHTPERDYRFVQFSRSCKHAARTTLQQITTAAEALGQTEIPAIVIAADHQEGLLMSLVENIARCPYRPIEQLRDVAALKSRGYSEAEIAQKIGVSVEYTKGILHLLEIGEHRLLRAVDAGQIPVSVAIDIAAANQSEIQHILQQAYEQNLLRGKRLVAAKRLLVQRRQKGKGLSDKRLHTNQYNLSELLKTYEEDTERKRLLVRKAEITGECLTFIVEAFRQLRQDHAFMALLKAERLDSIPKNLDLRIASEEAYA
ncbi:MAG TPA: recombinase family protein, partial [Terriglobia bacterium]|nr:recombinase family protein [Terriglobia bacterium]